MCNVCNNNRVKRLEFPLAGLIKYTLLLISTGFKLGIRLFGLVPNFVILYFFFVNSDKGGIQENNYSFTGAELYV